MQGDARVIEYLNHALRHELTAVNQYWLHYRLLDNWGYRALAKQWRKESIEEMQHADKIVERIIFLDGFPNLQVIDPSSRTRLSKLVLIAERDSSASFSIRGTPSEIFLMRISKSFFSPRPSRVRSASRSPSARLSALRASSAPGRVSLSSSVT